MVNQEGTDGVHTAKAHAESEKGSENVLLISGLSSV